MVVLTISTGIGFGLTSNITVLYETSTKKTETEKKAQQTSFSFKKTLLKIIKDNASDKKTTFM